MKDLKEALESPLTWIVAYLVVAIFTFGHAFNGVPKEEAGKFGGFEYVIQNGGGMKTTVGLLSGMFWPLYWSVKLQEKQ